MRHLVVDSCGAANVIALGYFATEDQYIFVESHTANVLHRAPVIFGDSNLVVLTKWISQTESLLEEGKALLGYFKDFFSVYVLEE